MAEISEIGIVDGAPVEGTGEVPTLAPVRDALLDIKAAVEGTVEVDTGLDQPLTDGQLRATPVPVSGTVTANLGTIAGVATAANQTTIIGHVDGIEALLTTIDADTSALAGTVGGSELQVDVVASLPSGSNTIGAVNLAQYTPASGRLPVDGSSVTQPVSGTVAVTGVATAENQTTSHGLLEEIAGSVKLFRPVDGEVLSPTNSASDESSALTAGRVWVKGNEDFHIMIGESPTATTSSSPPLTKWFDYYFYVEEGDEVSVITAGALTASVWIATENPI